MTKITHQCIRNSDFNRIFDSLSRIENKAEIIPILSSKIETLEEHIDKMNAVLNGNGKVGAITEIAILKNDISSMKVILNEISTLLNGTESGPGLKEILGSIKVSISIYSSIAGLVAGGIISFAISYFLK